MRSRPGVSFLFALTLVLIVAVAEARGQSSCTSNANCNDGNACTVDLCDPGTGCSHTPSTGNPCSDGNACTQFDLCSAGVCVPGAYLNCNDHNTCTDDSCDPSIGCVNVNNDTRSCSDDNICTNGDACHGGYCMPGAPVNCPDDGNPCTIELCEYIGVFPRGCIHVAAIGTSCQPENRCYEVGECGAGVCIPQGTPRSCDDSNPCTVDGCDYSTGCTHQGETCDDGNACTTDTCTLPDICSHQAADCNDLNACTQDDCDPVTGCSHLESGSCTENPKSVGYWQGVCRGNGNHRDSITDSDVNFIHAVGCTPYSVDSPDDICRILFLSDDENCHHADQEFLALALNLNHGRVSLSDGIDSRCGYQVTVAGAFADARRILCAHPCFVEPCDVGDTCELAECECREINQGRALHVHALVVSRLVSGAVRLSWIPPLGDADDLAATPRRYRVWRATDASGPFVEIAEVTEPAYDDTAASGERLVYDVTPVW